VNEFSAIFRISEIANVVTKHSAVFINLHHVAVHALTNWRSLLKYFRIACYIVLIDPRTRHIQLANEGT
jgi:hypothetical protein